jgi:nucleotide-binding universal stress UspA family protein
MTTTLIAGYDGSDAAAAAVRFARMLATATGGDVVAAAVHPPVPYVYAPGASTAADAELTAELREDARRRLETIPDDDVERVVVAAHSPAEGLHRLAEERRAALIAVGATHRGTLGRLLPGGVGDRLLHGSPSPVAVVPATWTERPCRTIAVGYDGRPESRTALRAAEELAGRLGARLDVVAVYDPAPYLWLTSTTPAPAAWDVPELRTGFEREIDAALETIDPAVRGFAHVHTGLPGPAIVDAVKRDVDLLVTGSRSYGPLRSVLAGSVARFLVDHAACPVLIVPRGASVGGGVEEAAAVAVAHA